MTVPDRQVPQAAVDAAAEAMYCKRAWQGNYCMTHNLSVEWTEQGCGYAVVLRRHARSAAAAAGAGPSPARATTSRSAR